ncbi:MAG: hypothetical protein ACTSR3_01060 [Candidatus Helarchaeota archaeon]
MVGEILIKFLDEYVQRYNLYRKAWNKFGENAQLIMIMEESAELIQAVAKYMRYGEKNIKDNIIEEMADVGIMIEQFLQVYSLESEFNKIRKKKIERLERRLKEIDN